MKRRHRGPRTARVVPNNKLAKPDDGKEKARAAKGARSLAVGWGSRKNTGAEEYSRDGGARAGGRTGRWSSRRRRSSWTTSAAVVNYDLGPKPPASSGGCRTIRDGTWRVVASHRLGRLAWFFPTRRKDGITPHRASRRIASLLSWEMMHLFYRSSQLRTGACDRLFREPAPANRYGEDRGENDASVVLGYRFVRIVAAAIIPPQLCDPGPSCGGGNFSSVLHRPLPLSTSLSSPPRLPHSP